MARIIPILPAEAQELLERLAGAHGVSPAALLEQLVRRAAREEGLLEEGDGEPFLVLESTEEVPAIGPEGRGRKVRLKAIDETGEWDAGELFVPDPPKDPDRDG